MKRIRYPFISRLYSSWKQYSINQTYTLSKSRARNNLCSINQRCFIIIICRNNYSFDSNLIKLYYHWKDSVYTINSSVERKLTKYTDAFRIKGIDCSSLNQESNSNWK